MEETLVSLRDFYQNAFELLDDRKRTPEIDVSFYPYININHTIRVRGGRVYVRLAEICRDMPAIAHQALSYILVAKLLGKRVPPEARRIYTEYTRTPEMRERAAVSKKSRGRKQVTSPTGNVYDLDQMFDELNGQYFQGRLSKPGLSWSQRRTFRILGHYDSVHHTIIISCSLDEASVPEFVVRFVMYHEMLHIFHPTKHSNGRRYNHTPEFRRDERRFELFDAAEDWIEKNIHSIKRKAAVKKC